MKFLVYHAKHPTFLDIKPSIVDMHNYEKVAEVETNGLEDCFRITNHIDHDWTTNPEVTWRKGSGANTRSTSVGDVIINENGKKFLCAMIGWKEI